MRLDLGQVVPVVTDRDGRPWPYLQVTDGAGLVEFAAGPGVPMEQAVLGAERLATAAVELVAELRDEAVRQIPCGLSLHGEER